MKRIFWLPAAVLAAAAIYYFFVPAFAGDIVIDPVLNLGPVSFRWYGLIMALAVLLGYFIARKNCWRFGIDKQEVDSLTFWLVIVGIVGARIYYVVFDLDYFLKNPQETYKIWHGGMSIFGSVIAGLIFLKIYSKGKAYSVRQLIDLVALSVPLAHAVGRFGNFFNQEAFGKPTDLPWKMYVDPSHRPPDFIENRFFHPTFLYDALVNAAVFGLLFYFKDRLKPGQLAAVYLASYGLGRFFIEMIRLDSVFVGGFRVDQIVAFLLLGAGIGLFFKWDKGN